MRQSSAPPLKAAGAAGVVADGARGEVWRAVALQAHLLGKPPRAPRARSAGRFQAAVAENASSYMCK